MDKTDQNSKRIDFGTVVILVIAMTIYAYIRLSDSAMVFTGALVLLMLLGTARIVIDYKASTRLDTAFDVAFFVVLLSVILWALKTSISAHPAVFFATVLYRPEYMRHGNRRLAFALSLMIMGMILPLTCGFVTDRDAVQVLSALYALLVASLWVFCSKLGVKAIGSGAGGTN